MSAVFQRKVPPELQIMPTNLRVLKKVGLLGNQRNLYRFVLILSWPTLVILVPKVVFGMGSNRFDAIAKGWSEFIYEGNLIVAVTIFSTKRTYLKQMIDLLNGIISKGNFNQQYDYCDNYFTILSVTDENQPETTCYGEICNQNGHINKFAKFYAVYCHFGPFVFIIPSVVTSYTQYFTTSANSSQEWQFELPMEQEYVFP